MFVFLIFMGYLFYHAGSWLVRKDKIEKADAIVILMGHTADRVLEANDVFVEGFSGKIIIINNFQIGAEALRQHGVIIPNKATLAVEALKQLGIEKERIFLLQGHATSTADEARIVKNYIEQNRLDTIILVTSNYHTRRASSIFEQEFDKFDNDVTVISCPSKYTGYDGSSWWKSREEKKIVFYEYLKLLNFYLFE